MRLPESAKTIALLLALVSLFACVSTAAPTMKACEYVVRNSVVVYDSLPCWDANNWRVVRAR